MLRNLREEIELIKQRDPAARNSLEIWLTYSGLHAVRSYRKANWFYRRKLYTIARIISQWSRFFTGIEIHPGATIGKGLFIDHGMGVVIGETTEIGDNCVLYQGVTLGGTGKEKGKRHPTLSNNVMVGAGARCGHSMSAIMLKFFAQLYWIPPNCTAVGVPTRVVKRDGMRVATDLDQIHMPDPVSQEMCKLKQMINCNKELRDCKERNSQKGE